ncbi:hypothetical protein NA56DRAFT_695220 [Hyaloscypha hepaticicola]|uniref:Uncharacterized protein n=1 Tax=Hyaloscypha hepaticicola TaxID=2082293 RepID=A0A2J6PFM2_9HELO|nr:hypothetical protein NA56DRAFT_695220 [Hyaloscypha hepaticicola]
MGRLAYVGKRLSGCLLRRTRRRSLVFIMPPNDSTSPDHRFQFSYPCDIDEFGIWDQNNNEGGTTRNHLKLNLKPRLLNSPTDFSTATARHYYQHRHVDNYNLCESIICQASPLKHHSSRRTIRPGAPFVQKHYLNQSPSFTSSTSFSSAVSSSILSSAKEGCLLVSTFFCSLVRVPAPREHDSRENRVSVSVWIAGENKIPWHHAAHSWARGAGLAVMEDIGWLVLAPKNVSVRGGAASQDMNGFWCFWCFFLCFLFFLEIWHGLGGAEVEEVHLR